MKLTKAEQKALDFIKEYLIENGTSPTYREIASHMAGPRSRKPLSANWAAQLVKRLKAKGEIKHNARRSRGINLVNEWATLMRVIARLPIEELRRIVRECT